MMILKALAFNSSFIIPPSAFIIYNDAMPRAHVNSRRRRRGSDAKGERRRDGRREELATGLREDAPERTAQGTGGRTLSRELRRLLEGIGRPAPAPFKHDPFQLEA